MHVEKLRRSASRHRASIPIALPDRAFGRRRHRTLRPLRGIERADQLRVARGRLVLGLADRDLAARCVLPRLRARLALRDRDLSARRLLRTTGAVPATQLLAQLAVVAALATRRLDGLPCTAQRGPCGGPQRHRYALGSHVRLRIVGWAITVRALGDEHNDLEKIIDHE